MMKKIGSLLGLGLALCLSLLFVPGYGVEAASRSLTIRNYKIEAQVQTNGDVQFEEKITFDARVHYNGVYYNLDYQGLAEPQAVSVSLQSTNQETLPLLANASQTPGSYEVSKEDGFLRFKVYQPLDFQEQTLVFRYSLPQLVTNYRDTAELNRRVVGAKWEIDQANIKVHVRLPGSADSESLRAWGHGGQGQSQVSIDGDEAGASFSVAGNSPGNFVEIHMLFPTRLTPTNPNQVDKDAFQDLVAQEANLAQQTQEKRGVLNLLKNLGLSLGGIVTVLNLGLAWISKKRRYAQVPHVPDHLFEPPENLPAAIMHAAVYGNASMKDFVATLSDLIRLGAVRLVSEDPLVLAKGKEMPLPYCHQKEVLEILFERMGSRDEISLNDLEDYAQNHPNKYTKIMDSWMNLVEEEARPFTVSQKNPTKGFTKVLLGLGLASLILSLIAILALDWASWLDLILLIGLLALTIITLIQTLSADRYVHTQSGELRYRQWQAFKRMLKDISSLDRARLAAIQLWDLYLVYAISLGIAKQVVKDLALALPNLQVMGHKIADPQMPFLYLQLQNSLTSTYARSILSDTSSRGSNASGRGGSFSSGSSLGSGGMSGGGGF